MAHGPEPSGSPTVVERTVRIDATPDIVFELLTDPDQYVRWKGRKARLDAQPGGEFWVEINDQAKAVGEYVEIDRPRRVVFTWGWDGHEAVPPGSSTVEITLEPDGEATILRLVHRDLPEAARDEHGHGWDHYLGRMMQLAAGQDPGPDPQSMPDA